MNTKVIAFYLPQYHEIPENNKWWGEGFTEWTNVKSGIPLYKNHYQPKVPLGNNYYCLLDSKVQEWQSKLAEEYGVYGFCYYHYWFNGKMLLEKPMENMLKNPNIKTKFCISWANEPWTRTWTGEEQDVLMAQSYGDEAEWENHLQYLLPFFLDDRYILKNNCPMFLIYRTENIDRCDEMISYWNERLKEYGFNGIYLLETITGWQTERKMENSSGAAIMEPMHTFSTCLSFSQKVRNYLSKKRNWWKFGLYQTYRYDWVWKKVLEKKYDDNTFYGAFTNWDNTARKGKKAILIKGFTPDKYKGYLESMFVKCEKENKEFLFFNAWNEWSEGTYLEPDTKYNNLYLNTIREMVKK